MIPSILFDVPVPTEEIPTHDGKDLAYVNWLADRVGYVFYMQPGPDVGTSFAYWGPEVKVGTEQSALSLDFDSHSTLDDVSFSYDATKATLPVIFIQEKFSRAPIPIPIPDITPLSPPLGLIPALPLKIEPIGETAKYNPLQAAVIGLAKAARASGKVVTAKGHARRAQLRPVAGAAAPRRRAGCRQGFRGPVLCGFGDQPDRARQLQAGLRAEPQRPAFDSRSGGSMMGPYLGKWRGTVVDNVDAEGRGRLKVLVPGVAGTALVNWAMRPFPSPGCKAASTPCRRPRPACGSSSSRASATSRSGPAATGRNPPILR